MRRNYEIEGKNNLQKTLYKNMQVKEGEAKKELYS